MTLRLSKNIKEFIKKALLEIDPGSKVLLFGSKTDDQAKGGDIDILWLTHEKIPGSKIREFKTRFYKEFGWQKIDIVNFTFQEKTPFKEIAVNTGIEL